jgi:type IV pilus assembly protein PilC
MFNSGCSLIRAFDMLAQQLENRVLVEACTTLSRQVQSGHYMSQAMKKLPWAFTRVQISLIQIGEKAGQLGAVLIKLADHEESQLELRLKVRNALTMPLIICSMCVLMVVVIPPILFSGLFEILRETGAELPMATRILMGFNHFLCSGWSALAALAAGLMAAAAVAQWRRSLTFQVNVYQKLLQVPVLGTMLKMMILTRLSRSLQTLLEVGIPIMQAIELSGETCDCAYLSQGLKGVLERVREGDSLSDSFASFDFFPSAFVQSVSAGEESGQLSSMIGSLAQMYRVELDHSLELLTKSLEPLVLGLVGGIVCFVVVATLSPMLKMVESL